MKFNNRNVYISPKAKIGKNVRVGDNTVIYDCVEIGENTTICNDCVIGEPASQYYRDIESYENPITIIGENSLIRSHCIIYSGSTFGDGLITGHRATIRENSVVGENCLISTLVDIQGNCSIGDYSRIYSNVHVSELTKIGSYSFIFPYTIFTNDPIPPSNKLVGATVGDFTMIAVHCCILPGVTIGSNVLVAANSVISRDIDDYSLATGTPARKVKDIRDHIDKNTGDAHYPWPKRFERGMPWENIGFDKWLKQNND